MNGEREEWSMDMTFKGPDCLHGHHQSRCSRYFLEMGTWTALDSLIGKLRWIISPVPPMIDNACHVVSRRYPFWWELWSGKLSCDVLYMIHACACYLV
jgi:hypothetical protein